jgi:hypothetical protein
MDRAEYNTCVINHRRPFTMLKTFPAKCDSNYTSRLSHPPSAIHRHLCLPLKLCLKICFHILAKFTKCKYLFPGCSNNSNYALNSYTFCKVKVRIYFHTTAVTGFASLHSSPCNGRLKSMLSILH